MKRKKFRFSEEFTKRFIELAEGSLSSEEFESVLSLLEEEASKFYFSPSSEVNLIRALNAIYDKRSFLSELLIYPHHSEILITITASSNYLTDIIVRNPEYLYQIFDQEYLERLLDEDNLKSELISGIGRYSTVNAKLNYIRQFKKRYILKIGLTDLLGIGNLEEITYQLSALAKVINSVLFDFCYSEILKKYGMQNVDNGYCLCALGKLGGNELNYSSDVDMLLFYDENRSYGNKEYHEILSEAALLYIKYSTEITERGYIYRVDFRLRPDGKYSPLCKSYTDYTRYYEARGEDWERQMLIKLDFVSGDRKLYKKFYDFLQPYIFPSSFAKPLKAQIKKMKANIELHNKSEKNIKLFAGGIRDIEFTVQALQLINGGKIKELRTGNTLKAIKILTSHNLLNERESELLKNAYITYRKIEHFLQLMNDTQTHLIPEEGEMLFKLCKYLGVKSPTEFNEKLEWYRKEVRKIYNDILGESDEESSDLFGDIKFADVNRAEKNLKYLRSGIGYLEQKQFDSRTIEIFSGLEKELASYLEKSAAPDITLENFVKIIRATKFPSIWYTQLAGAEFFKDFLRICEFASKTVDIIVIDKLAEESFLSGEVFLKDLFDDLSNFNLNKIILTASLQYALGFIDASRVSEILCEFIDSVIREECDIYKDKFPFFIAGLGSYGTIKMHFASDIDLIVVTDDITKHPEIHSVFQKVLGKLKDKLPMFEIDFRLRPEGKSSPLVWDISNYKQYLKTRARTWELQALWKSRMITGVPELFENFRKEVALKVYESDAGNLKKDILEMYNRIQKDGILTTGDTFNIKKQRGGLLTIDFLTQFIALSNVEIFESTFGKPTVYTLEILAKEIDKNDFETLGNNYKKLKEIELAIQIIFNTKSTIVPLASEKKNLLAAFFDRSPEEFMREFNAIVKDNNRLFEKYTS
jgi:glutamate-ammonia-ligase adenylyltransferase